MRLFKSSPLRRSAAALEWLALVCMTLAPGCGVHAAESAAGAVPQAAGEPQPLYLRVVINEVARPSVHEVLRRGDALSVSGETLRELGLRVPLPAGGGDPVPLAALPGVTAVYREQLQELRLTVPPAFIDGLPLRLVSGLQADVLPDRSQRVRGVLVNYDLFVQQAERSSSASGQAELRLFSPGGGTWTQSVVGRLLRTQADSTHEAVRLDTAWRYEDAQDLVAVAVGDTVTRSVGWTRPMRIAGLQLARDLGLQPYRATAPLLSLTGEAALPSTVELFINGLRQMSQPVLPGQFRIDAIPTVSGLGSAQVVVTDLNGRAQRIDVPFYAAPALLQEGLWDGSLEAGFPRRAYGMRSADYASSPVALATLRYGMNDEATLEGHAEAAKDIRMLGAGMLYRLPQRLGVASGSLALSASPARTGRQQSWSYQFIGTRSSLTWTLVRRSPGFRDAVSAVDGPPLRSLASLSVGASTPLGHWSLGWARQVSPEGVQGSLLSAGVTLDLPGRSVVNLSVVSGKGPQLRSRQFMLTWSMPLEQRGTLSAGYTRNDGRATASLDVTHDPSPGQGEIGYRLHAFTDGSDPGAHAQLRWTSQSAHWTAGLAYPGRGSGSVLYGGMDGSLLVSGDRVRAMERAGDAFALVSTSGVPGIPVRLENRPVGSTDDTGTLLVPGLSAYQRNRLSIDTLGLPADYRIGAVEAQAVPERRAGVAVQFSVRPVHKLEVAVVDDTGQFLAPGTVAEVSGSGGELKRTVVGQDGLLYVEDPPAGAREVRARGEFGTCTAALGVKAPAPSGVAPPILCRKTP